jgi:hypothetical protein
MKLGDFMKSAGTGHGGRSEASERFPTSWLLLFDSSPPSAPGRNSGLLTKTSGLHQRQIPERMMPNLRKSEESHHEQGNA